MGHWMLLVSPSLCCRRVPVYLPRLRRTRRRLRKPIEEGWRSQAICQKDPPPEAFSSLEALLEKPSVAAQEEKKRQEEVKKRAEVG